MRLLLPRLLRLRLVKVEEEVLRVSMDRAVVVRLGMGYVRIITSVVPCTDCEYNIMYSISWMFYELDLCQERLVCD